MLTLLRNPIEFHLLSRRFVPGAIDGPERFEGGG
jgi:hypothetical protein